MLQNNEIIKNIFLKKLDKKNRLYFDYFDNKNNENIVYILGLLDDKRKIIFLNKINITEEIINRIGVLAKKTNNISNIDFLKSVFLKNNKIVLKLQRIIRLSFLSFLYPFSKKIKISDTDYIKYGFKGFNYVSIANVSIDLIGEIGNKEDISFFKKVFEESPVTGVKFKCLDLIVKFIEKDSIDFLKHAYETSFDGEIKVKCLELMIKLGGKNIIDYLCDTTKDTRFFNGRYICLNLIIEIGKEKEIDFLKYAFKRLIFYFKNSDDIKTKIMYLRFIDKIDIEESLNFLDDTFINSNIFEIKNECINLFLSSAVSNAHKNHLIWYIYNLIIQNFESTDDITIKLIWLKLIPKLNIKQGREFLLNNINSNIFEIKNECVRLIGFVDENL